MEDNITHLPKRTSAFLEKSDKNGETLHPGRPATPTPIIRHPNNLPLQVTSLVGRTKEIEAAVDRLFSPTVRLLTLTGPGGIGKTRLALEVAERVLDAFEDGVFFVVLAPVRDPSLVLPAIGQTLGLKEEGAKPLNDLLKDHLRNRQVLLILDNFEQVIAAGPQVAQLLPVCPKLTLMVTSREALRVQSEHLFPVPPLQIPEPGESLPVERLSECEAVRLFVERARAVRMDFVLSEENADAVRDVCCRRLEGLPLAIELAAARISLFSPKAMQGRMENRLKLLTGGSRDVPERLQTMRNAIAWSHDLLEEHEKRLFRRLSVFVGGCTLGAAEVVCQNDTELGLPVTEGLASLLGKSLLRVEQGEEPRFAMLETIREYGKECLEAADEIEGIRRHHAMFYLNLVTKGDFGLVGQLRQEWVDLLEAEHDNFREALAWALENGEGEAALWLASFAGRVWVGTGNVTEGRAWLKRALETGSGGNSLVRAQALTVASHLAWQQGDLTSGFLSREALAIGRERLSKGIGLDAENRRLITDALIEQSIVAMFQGGFGLTQAAVQECLRVLDKQNDRPNIGLALLCLGHATLGLGENSQARSMFEEGLAIARQFGLQRLVGLQLLGLGLVAMAEQDYVLAQTLSAEYLAIARELGLKRSIGTGLGQLAWTMYEQGDFTAARSAAEEGLLLLREVGDRIFGSLTLWQFAEFAVRQGEAGRSARLLGCYESLRESMGITEMLPCWSAGIERTVAETRSRLPHPEFATAWKEGRTMTFEQAIDYALALPVPPPQPASGQGKAVPSGPLTRREQEVAALVALGISNREIAARLVISERTVDRHVANILGKLHFTSRVQLALWTGQYGLLPPQSDQ